MLMTTKETPTRKLSLFLPLNITTEYWQRHKYTEMDILLTLKKQSARSLVKLAVVLDIPIPTPCIKIYVSSSDMFLITSKMAILNKVCDKIRKTIKFGKKDRLQSNSLIPTHRVSKTFFSSCKKNFNPNQEISFISSNKFKAVNIYLDILWVPFSYNKDGFLRMRRIIPSNTVNPNMKKYIMRSFEVVIDDKHYRSTDEEMYIYSY